MQAAVPPAETALLEVVTRKCEGHFFWVCGLLVHYKRALAEPKEEISSWPRSQAANHCQIKSYIEVTGL